MARSWFAMGWLGCSITLGGSLLLGCGGAAGEAKSTESAPAGETDLEALFRREKELTFEATYADPRREFRGKVRAAGEPVVAEGDELVQVSVPLGTESTVDCFVYRKTIDAGQAVTIMMEHVRQNVEFGQVAPYRIAHAQGMPIVFLRGRYTKDSPAGKLMGDFKMAVSPRFDHPIACIHDEPGYGDTFTDVVTSLLENVESNGQSRPAKFHEIWVVQMDDLPVGYRLYNVYDELDGTTTGMALSSMFIPVGPGELSTSDSVEVVKSDATGVQSGHWLSIEGRETDHDITLTRKGKKKYHYVGKLQGKPLEGNFDVATGLTDDLVFYRFLARNRGKSTTLDAIEYMPSVDPTKPSLSHYVLAADSVTHDTGSMKMKAVRAEDGLMGSFVVPIGPRELRGTLLDRTGRP